jgi:hypothetical protein
MCSSPVSVAVSLSRVRRRYRSLHYDYSAAFLTIWRRVSGSRPMLWRVLLPFAVLRGRVVQGGCE